MVEEYPFLEEAKIAADIENNFIAHYEKAENYAASGNVAAVKQVMEKFSKIKSKIPSIFHLIKIAYWAQIEEAAREKASDQLLQEAFGRYQQIFGYESMLEDLLKSIQQFRALTFSFDTQANRCYMGSVEALDLKIIA